MFKLTADQAKAQEVIGGEAQHVQLEGGSRSGKTFLICKTIATRALVAPRSNHAIFRFRFNHVKTSIIHDTWPKMMELCFPEVAARTRVDKSDWFYPMPNGSKVWFGGLDDKERTEKVLGQEHATLFLNEVSQISWSARNLALTRLAQKAAYQLPGEPSRLLRLKAFYDCNPPSKAHWCYKVFHQGIDPENNKPLADSGSYQFMRLNPNGNRENLAPEYLKILDNLPERMRKRFRDGEYTDVTDGALWSIETIEKWRELDAMPSRDEFQRIIVAVDPSGSGDEENTNNDAIGIVVAGLGVDGRAYLLEDLTVKAGPRTWGNVVAAAFDRWQADRVVAEKNFGGEMVRFVIQTARPGTPVSLVNASRGKSVRAEPISALHEQGRIRFAGSFPELEDELLAFTIHGYAGDRSPNRADAFVWAMTALFPSVIRQEKPAENTYKSPKGHSGSGAWMAS